MKQLGMHGTFQYILSCEKSIDSAKRVSNHSDGNRHLNSHLPFSIPPHVDPLKTGHETVVLEDMTDIDFRKTDFSPSALFTS